MLLIIKVVAALSVYSIIFGGVAFGVLVLIGQYITLPWWSGLLAGIPVAAFMSPFLYYLEGHTNWLD